MKPATLKLVTADSAHHPEQLTLRPVIVFVREGMPVPFRVRLLCRRPPRRTAPAAPKPAPRTPLDLLAYRPPVRPKRRPPKPVRPAALHVFAPRKLRPGARPRSMGLRPISDVERRQLLVDEAALRRAGVLETRPKKWGDCELRACPWCNEHVTMRLTHDRSDGPDVRKTDGNPAGGKQALRQQEEHSSVAREMRVRQDDGGARRISSDGRHDELRLPADARAVRDARKQGVVFDDPALHQPEEQELSALRGKGDTGTSGMAGLFPGVPGVRGRATVGGVQPGQDRFERKLRAGKRSMGDGHNTKQEQAHVSCPECGGRVVYVVGVGGADWSWEKHDPRASPTGMDASASAGLRRALATAGACPFISCRANLYAEVDDLTGALKLNFPDKEVWELEETCALRVVQKRGALSLEEVGKLVNLTQERVSTIEEGGMAKMKRRVRGPGRS